MKVKIEDYRGWEITFDTEDEVFNVFSDYNDTESNKKSYASAKKYIDDFIKDNSTFKPINIICNANSYHGKSNITLTGVRKDGKFTYEENGKKCIFSTYDEDRYILDLEENQEAQKELDAFILEMEKQNKLNRERRNAIESKIKVITLKEYKKNKGI